MPPKGPRWEELSWSWAYSTGQPDSDQALEAAAKAAWPYSLLCAWTYLNDSEAAYDLMDHAVQNTSDYLGRHPGAPIEKLSARTKSVIRRRAKQLAAKRSRELSYGSLADLETMYAGRPEIEQRVYANELLAHLSPFANSIVYWRWLGYSWREIAKQFGMDHTAVRRAYFRELKSLVQSLSQSGDSPRCRLNLRWPSRVEDRFEKWIAQNHQARVLAGETTPVGPCPDEAFLRNLARKSQRIALSDPRIDHAATCPACMARLLTLRRDHRSRRRRLVLAAAAVTCLLIVAVLVSVDRYWVHKQQSVATVAVLSKTVNLWDAGTFRGEQPGPLQSVSLPAARVSLTIILPRFSPAGPVCGCRHPRSER